MVSRWMLLPCLALGLPGCIFDDCDRAGCEATSKPVKNPGIDTGIAGAASSKSDVVDNGCNECGLTSGTLQLWNVAMPVATADEAKALVQSADAAQTVTFEEFYEEPLDPGDYLICAGSGEMTCAALSIETGVVTVHVRYIFGPTQLTIFEPGSSEARMDDVWEVFVPG